VTDISEKSKIFLGSTAGASEHSFGLGQPKDQQETEINSEINVKANPEAPVLQHLCNYGVVVVVVCVCVWVWGSVWGI
jgi:hypothetical protein